MAYRRLFARTVVLVLARSRDLRPCRTRVNASARFGLIAFGEPIERRPSRHHPFIIIGLFGIYRKENCRTRSCKIVEAVVAGDVDSDRSYARPANLEEHDRPVVKQSRALDWMAIDGALRKQDSSFGPSALNLLGESNQTFMLNHETIRMESANKRAGSPISPSPLEPSPGHLTLLFTRPRRTKS